MTDTMELQSVNPYLLTVDERHLLQQLVRQWQLKLGRNLLRRRYYDAHNTLKDLGIAIPPQLKRVETVVGWPAKAVDTLAARIRFDGFVNGDGEPDPLGLGPLLVANEFQPELDQAIQSMLTHSCAFVSLTAGDPTQGEPPVVIRFRSALWATGIWNRRARGLSSALVVNDVDEDQREIGILQPTSVTLFLPSTTILMERQAGGEWAIDRQQHALGHVPVHLLRYRPDLDRPFGRSRISRPVLAFTDSAVRTLLRSEVSAEFFTSPQRYALGVDEEAFTDDQGNPIPAWSAMIGRLLVLTRDSDGNAPTAGQFPQLSMQPHADEMKLLAAQFSGETGVPMSQLGIMTDSGPSSADAIDAAQDPLIGEAEKTIDLLDLTLRQVAADIVAIRDQTTVLPDLDTLQAVFRRPDRPSQAAMADAALKQVQAVPWLAETTVFLEALGYTQPQIARLQAERRAAVAAGTLQQLTTGPNTPQQGGANGDNSSGRATPPGNPAAGDGPGFPAARPAVATSPAGTRTGA
jgi:hypothetical protein